MRRSLTVLAILLALGACVPMQWARPGASLTELGEDMGACRRAAADQAWREEVFGFGFASPFRRSPPWSGSRFATSDFGGFRTSPLDRWRREDELTGFCMRIKGYRLEPVPGTAAPAKP